MVRLSANQGCTTSNLLRRLDAMRCFTTPAAIGGNVFDPCFPGSAGQYLVCPQAPWSEQWVKIDAQGDVGNIPSPSTDGLPWGLRTSTGVLCAQAGGATNTVDGLRLSFWCSDDTALYGDPVRGTTWSIKSGPSSGGPLKTVNLATAWY